MWYARTSSPLRVALYDSDVHPEGKSVVLNDVDLLADPEALSVADVLDFDGHLRVSRVHLEHRERYNGAPPLWYALVDDTRNGIPALVLVAFADERLPAGTIASLQEAVRAGADVAAPAGALRWLPGSGAVHQVETHPSWRRRQVGTRLLAVAATICAAHSWPQLSGGEDRTLDGNALLSSLPPAAAPLIREWTSNPTGPVPASV